VYVTYIHTYIHIHIHSQIRHPHKPDWMLNSSWKELNCNIKSSQMFVSIPLGIIITQRHVPEIQFRSVPLLLHKYFILPHSYVSSTSDNWFHKNVHVPLVCNLFKIFILSSFSEWSGCTYWVYSCTNFMLVYC
jgi:hypothetical protein